eukprot:scaffold311035_cov24-Tisochrysis_lutea.AAC.1
MSAFIPCKVLTLHMLTHKRTHIQKGLATCTMLQKRLSAQVAHMHVCVRAPLCSHCTLTVYTVKGTPHGVQQAKRAHGLPN